MQEIDIFDENASTPHETNLISEPNPISAQILKIFHDKTINNQCIIAQKRAEIAFHCANNALY